MEKTKVIKSLIYKFSERFAVKGIGLVIQILLARLLAPEAFGQIALLIVFTDLSLNIVDSGLNAALIQSREVDDRDYSTVLYISLALAVVMIAVLQLVAPVIARFYDSPGLVAPMRVYAFSLLFSAFNSVQVAQLQRAMRFREIMFCNLAASLSAGLVAIFFAYRGLGLWTLVIYYFSHIVITSLVMLFVLRWLPHSRFSLDSAKRLYGFGLSMLAASLIQTLYYNLRPLIIGKKFSTADLGYYDRGQRFSNTIALNLDTSIQNVMFPVFSREQDDPAILRGMLRRTKKMGCFLIFPVMLGMAAVARPLILLLLTDKWLPSVIFLQILCAGDMTIPFVASNLMALKALGESRLYARQEVVRRVAMLVLLLVSVLAFHSVEAIAVSYALSSWIDGYITSRPIKKLLDYGFLSQLKDIWKSGLSSLLMALGVYALGALPLSPLLLLLLQVIAGVLFYLLLNLLLKNESLYYLFNMLRGRRKAA